MLYAGEQVCQKQSEPAGWAVKVEPETIRSALDRRILEARQRVEKLCVAKAKAETLGLLDAPWSDLETIIYG